MTFLSTGPGTSCAFDCGANASSAMPVPASRMLRRFSFIFHPFWDIIRGNSITKLRLPILFELGETNSLSREIPCRLRQDRTTDRIREYAFSLI
jgi:hypothetical protein